MTSGLHQSQQVAMLWLPQPWSPSDMQIVCAVTSPSLARAGEVNFMLDGSQKLIQETTPPGSLTFLCMTSCKIFQLDKIQFYMLATLEAFYSHKYGTLV